MTPWTVACHASLSITKSQSLLKLISVVLVMPSNHLIFCCPLLLLSIFPSIRIFSNESVLCIRWPKHWSFSNSPLNENSGFRIGWFHLLEVWRTLKSFLQHHSSKASIFQCSAFFSFLFFSWCFCVCVCVCVCVFTLQYCIGFAIHWHESTIAFFMVQLSHPYMTTGKTTALTRWTFVGQVMSVLMGQQKFNKPRPGGRAL